MERDDWIIIGTLIVVTIVWFVLFMITVLRKKKPEAEPKPKPKSEPKSEPKPISISPVSSSTVSKLNFNSVKTIDGNGTNFFYMNEGYLSFRQVRDMSQWGIDKPLNYTHAKINNLIFKFNNSNSSDSSGFVVDDFGNRRQTQPPSEFSSKLDFGIFM